MANEHYEKFVDALNEFVFELAKRNELQILGKDGPIDLDHLTFSLFTTDELYNAIIHQRNHLYDQTTAAAKLDLLHIILLRLKATNEQKLKNEIEANMFWEGR